MPTVQELQAQLDALRAVRASGTLRVDYADGSGLTYRDDAQLAAAIADLEKRIAVQSGTSRPQRLILSPSSGIEC